MLLRSVLLELLRCNNFVVLQSLKYYFVSKNINARAKCFVWNVAM